MDLLLGNHGGVLGETCAITILLGGIAAISLVVGGIGIMDFCRIHISCFLWHPVAA